MLSNNLLGIRIWCFRIPPLKDLLSVLNMLLTVSTDARTLKKTYSKHFLWCDYSFKFPTMFWEPWKNCMYAVKLLISKINPKRCTMVPLPCVFSRITNPTRHVCLDIQNQICLHMECMYSYSAWKSRNAWCWLGGYLIENKKSVSAFFDYLNRCVAR